MVDNLWIRRVVGSLTLMGEVPAGMILISDNPEQANILIPAWIVGFMITTALTLIPPQETEVLKPSSV